jgi:hypothetical protein
MVSIFAGKKRARCLAPLSSSVRRHMSDRRKFEMRFLRSLRVMNLKSAVAAQGFFLIVGVLLITNSRSGGELFASILLVALESACVMILEDRLRLAALVIGIPNLVISAFVTFFGSWQSPMNLLWILTTGMMALVCLFVSRMPIEARGQSNEIYSSQNDA